MAGVTSFLSARGSQPPSKLDALGGLKLFQCWGPTLRESDVMGPESGPGRGLEKLPCESDVWLGLNKPPRTRTCPLSVHASSPAAPAGPADGGDVLDLSPYPSRLGGLAVLGHPWQSPPEALLL